MILKDYLLSSGDKETALDLWLVAKRKLENIHTFLQPVGLFDNEAAVRAEWWLFVDWNNTLDRQAAIQDIIIFPLKETSALAYLLGKGGEVGALPALIKRMTAAAIRNLYNKQNGVFTSGPKKQVSFASQAWMTLSVVASKAEAQLALIAVQELK